MKITFNSHIKQLIKDEKLILKSLVDCYTYYVKDLSAVEINDITSSTVPLYKADMIIVYDFINKQYKVLKNRYGSDGSIHPLESLSELIEYSFPIVRKGFENFYDKNN
jgi:hypothetical protein